MTGPVLAWRETYISRGNNGYDAHAGPVRVSVYVSRDSGAWCFHPATYSERGPFDSPVAAQLAAEDWLRERLAPLAPLFTTGGTDAEQD